MIDFLLHFTSTSLGSLLVGVAGIIALVHLAAWIVDPYSLWSIPGPRLAKISAAWMGWLGHTHRINAVLQEQHIKYGKLVRVAPNHVSIVDAEALHIIYGHSSKALKSEFYDALVQFGGSRSVFTTRSREEHARKRKFVAHALSMRSVLEFEPTIHKYQDILANHWDRMCSEAANGVSGCIGAQRWTARSSRAWFDCMQWINFVAFDVIGDLAFGSPFGMTSSGRDLVQVAKSQDAVLESFGTKEPELETTEIPAVKTILDRSDYTTASALLPPWARPFLLLFPTHIRGSLALERFGTVAAAAIARRLLMPSDKVDLLSKMVEVTDDGGRSMGNREISAEATTLLVAGSDTISNSTCAMVFHLAKNQDKQIALRKELDAILGTPSISDSFDDYASLWDKIKNIAYLEAVVNEGLRLHSAVGVGLPRVVPEGGISLLGHRFKEGTVLSVPVYSLHRDSSVWGSDAESFRPERWFDGDKAAMHRAFAPFSTGPRACVGRNLAQMEMMTFVATLFHRYDFVLERPDQKELEVHEGLVRKPLRCNVGIKRRG